jgi:hypothetical protein
MRISALSFFLVTSTFLFSQSPSWQWAKSHGGAAYDFGNSIALSSSGEIYVTGNFLSPSITFGTFTLTNTGSSGGDIFLAKYDASGNVVWATSAGGNGDDYANSVTVDGAGNIYVTGGFQGATILFDTIALTNADTTAASPDIFLAKYTPSGTLAWVKRAGGSDWEIPQCVATDPNNGDVCISGGTSSAAFVFASDTLVTQGGVDVLLCKFDSSGTELWARSAGGTLNDLANGMCIDAAGKIYLPGGFASDSILFGSNTLVNAGAGLPDIFFVKYDEAGNVIWSTREGGTDNDHAVSVSTVVGGKLFITGHYHSTSFTAGSDLLSNEGMGDVFVMQYDTSGNLQWAKSHGGMDHDFAYSVSGDAAGNAVVSGMFMSDSISFGAFGLQNSMPGEEEIFITEYDASGNVLWTLSAGGAGDDWVNSTVIDPSGTIFLTGAYSSDSLTLGATVVTNSGTSGTHDVLVGRLSVLTGETVLTDNENDFKIYPNPSGGLITVEPADAGNKFKVRVTNTSGEILFETETSDPKFTFDLSGFTNGVYILQIVCAGEMKTRQVVIVR